MLTILFNKVEHFDDLMGLGPFRVEADISFSYSVVKGQLNGISRDLFDGRTLSSGQVGNPARPRRGWGPSGSGRGLGAMGALPWSRLGLFRRARSGLRGPGTFTDAAPPPMSDVPQYVYKVFLPEQLELFRGSGEFIGSADDARDGFIHLSFATQVERTIKKHFQDRPDLAIAEFERTTWGEALRLEVSRDEQLFPHLYGVLLWPEVRRWLVRADFSPSP